MKMTDKQKKEFEEKANSLIKFMNDNPSIFCPHDKVIIDLTSAEIVSGEFMHRTEEFLKD